MTDFYIADLMFNQSPGQQESVAELGSAIKSSGRFGLPVDIKGGNCFVIKEFYGLIVELSVGPNIVVWEVLLKYTAELLS